MSELILTDAPQITANEMLLAKETAETLYTSFPGYLWGVTISESVVDVRCLNLSGQWGYTLHIPAIYSASEWKRTVRNAGGEILERYRQSRRGLNEQDVLQAKRDFAGNLLFDR